MDLSCKFGINKFFLWKNEAVFYKNRNIFLRQAIAAVTFGSALIANFFNHYHTGRYVKWPTHSDLKN